nr:TFIIB-type zinc ribbon-containing protein [bacterium]
MTDRGETMAQTDEFTLPPRERTHEETDAKCPNCGATVLFDPATGGLKCEYCGWSAEVPPPEEGREVCEMDFDTAESTGNYEWGAEKKMVICKSCGAQSVYDQLMVSDICPYCGATAVMQEVGQKSLAPNGVCPFEISGKQAEQRFRTWLGRRWFTPGKAKKSVRADRFTGVYMPYWTFDCNTTSNYSARYGKDRRVKQGDKYVTVTDWYSCSGVYSRFFDDVLVNASSRQQDSDVRKVEPYNLKKGVPYQPEFVAGFVSERYSVGLKSGWEKGRGRIRSSLESEIGEQIRTRYHADRVSGLNFSTRYANITYKYMILPLWMSSFRYKNKTYRFLVNGQTGKVGGKAPISWLRVLLAVAVGLAILLLLYYGLDVRV